MESERIHAEALIVSDYSGNYSHWNAVECEPYLTADHQLMLEAPSA